MFEIQGYMLNTNKIKEQLSNFTTDELLRFKFSTIHFMLFYKKLKFIKSQSFLMGILSCLVFII